MPAYDISVKSNELKFETTMVYQTSCCKIDTNHFIKIWNSDYNATGYAQIFAIDTNFFSWQISTANSALNLTVRGRDSSCWLIDTNHVITFLRQVADDGFAQILEVNTSTWAITTATTPLEFDTQNGLENACYKIDTNHFINFWKGGASAIGYTQVFTVDTSTWAITTANSSLNFDTQDSSAFSVSQIDTNHFINFWQKAVASGYAQVFTVDTSTWAITTANSSLNFDTTQGGFNACYKIDTNHFINFWQNKNGSVFAGFAQVFTVDTSTWAITTAASVFQFDTVDDWNNCNQLDTNHFINFWKGVDTHGFTQIFTVNTSTWEITASSVSSLEFEEDYYSEGTSLKIDTNHFINFWRGLNDGGYVSAFEVELPLTPSGPANLKTYNTNPLANIKTINTNAIANVKTLNTNA